MGEAKKKSNLSQEAMNKIVSFVAKHQNDSNKLNAGEIREMVRLVTIGTGVYLTHEEADAFHNTISRDPLTRECIKENRIAALKAELSELETEKSEEVLEDKEPTDEEQEPNAGAEVLPF